MRFSQAISDKKLPNVPNATIDYFVADITSSTDYYPFGSPMDGRAISGVKYRFGFNGKEKDDEVAGAGNINTALFWEYYTRLGRQWNVDPKPNPSISYYTCFGNNPIMNRDILGDTWDLKWADGFTDEGKWDGENVRNFNKDYGSLMNKYLSGKELSKQENNILVAGVREVTKEILKNPVYAKKIEGSQRNFLENINIDEIFKDLKEDASNKK